MKWKHIIYDAHVRTSSGCFTGNVTLVISLCILGRGDVLNLAVIFDIEAYCCRKPIFYVLLEWIFKCNVVDINMVKHI